MAPQFSPWLLSIAIIHCGVVFPAANAEEIFVRPNASVLCPGGSQPCLTFNEYAQEVNQYFVDNTTFLFLPGTHELNTQLYLMNLSNISFAPSDEANTHDVTVQILLSPSVNITWTNCDNIEINGLVFILSGQFSVVSDMLPLFSVELFFQETTGFLTSLTIMGNGTRQFAMCISSHIQISKLVVTGVRAPTLSAFYSSIDFYGQSMFVNNEVEDTNATYILALESSYCNFSGSISFVNNTGIGIIAGELSLSFVNSTFSSVLDAEKLSGKSITIISGDILFINNSGGQILLYETTCYISGNVLFKDNIIAVQNFDTFGGGAAISVTQNSTLSISGAALFVRNRAVDADASMEYRSDAHGGAIRVADQSRMIFEETSNISFIENSAEATGGAIFILNSNLTMRGTVLFKRNSALIDGGAVYVLDSSINLIATLHFIQNFARRGGAMAFSGPSGRLRLTEPLTANFVENSAILSGGAIFFEDDISTARQMCLRLTIFTEPQNCSIELSSRGNIRLNFDNNIADIAGRILYGGHLDNCLIPVGGVSSSNPLDEIISISNINVNNYKDNTTSNVSSDPLQVCICKSDGLICNIPIDMRTVRGREFTLQAVVVGQGMGIVPTAIRISLDNGVQISAAQRIQNTGKTCTNITYRLFAENSSTVVTLFPDDGPCRDIGIGRTLINISFLPCPNGFIQNGSQCVCEERLQRFSARCNVDNTSIEWRPSNKFWLGALYDNDSNESTYSGLILHSGCPFDYCVDTPVPITLDNLDVQCNHNHSGILCGSCRENYSIAFSTLHCLRCGNSHLALILPFALAGVALVVLLLLLRLTVTVGAVNGLIFYANIIQANRSIFFPDGATNVLTVFIAWLNLDLGIETCFYDGMTTYAYTWLQFLFPFYVWLLIGLIVVMSHYSRKLTRFFGKNPVAVLSTLFLLSYAKILGTIITALSTARLEYPHGNSKMVWLYDGNVAYAETQGTNHLALIIIATLLLVLLFTPYTLLLFCAHWLQAYSHWRILSWLNKIKPFMDAYHAPYKKQTRYWTGLLLFARLIIFGFDVNNSELIPVVLTSITAVLMAMAWLHKGIYENRFNDLLEAFFVANLCIFSVTTYQTSTYAGVGQAGLSYFFVGIALAAFVCIMLFHIYMILCETAIWKKIPTKFYSVRKYFIHRGKEEGQDLPSDHNIHQQSFTETKKPPTQTFIELREPLLEQ